MKKQIEKDAKNLYLALIVGVSFVVISFVCAFICCADSWFEHFFLCLKESGKLALWMGGISAVATLLFPSTVKFFIRWSIKQAKSE